MRSARQSGKERLHELICGGNKFVFSTFLYHEPLQRSENTVEFGRPGSCNNSRSESILEVLKAIYLRFMKIIVHGIAIVKSGVNERCASGVSCIKVKKQSGVFDGHNVSINNPNF